VTPTAGRTRELVAWIAALVLLNTFWVFGRVASGDLFGIDALRQADTATLTIAVVVLFASGVVFALADPPLRVPPFVAAILAAASFPLFYALRTGVLNEDGNALQPRFLEAVPRVGAYLTHDELLEFYVHSRFWWYTHRWWGWSVVLSYQVLSCAAGMAFVYGVVRLAPRLAPRHPSLFALGAVSGGYMQLFFGDAENYTVTAALIVFYLIAAVRYVAGDVRLRVPAACLAVAMCFHLETGWMLPSLVFLASVERRRGGHDLAASAAIFGAIGAATVVYFHFHGLPLWQFFSSHAGHALRSSSVFSIGMPWTYFVELARLFVLLCPSSVLVLPLLVSHVNRDETTWFMIVAAASLLLLQLVWRAQLGMRDDWNLFAIGGLVTTCAIWRGVDVAAVSRPARVVAALTALSGCLHTYAWIAANHAGRVP
jgi:hypothetical protein